MAYDVTMCVPNAVGQEARQLMARAYKHALTIPNQQQLLSELENDSKLVYHIGLTPSKVSNLNFIKQILNNILASRIGRK